MLPRLLLTIALLALLAGCSAPPADDASTDAAADARDAAPSLEPVAVNEADPVPVTATCTLTRTNIGTTTGYGLNIDRAVFGLEECRLDDLFGGNTSWAQAALVEVTWTNQASQTGTDLWIESEACQPALPPACVPPSTMGASSPLDLALSTAELRSIEDKNALVMASGQGFVNEVEYTFYVTLFPEPTVPSGFTAIP